MWSCFTGAGKNLCRVTSILQPSVGRQLAGFWVPSVVMVGVTPSSPALTRPLNVAPQEQSSAVAGSQRTGSCCSGSRADHGGPLWWDWWPLWPSRGRKCIGHLEFFQRLLDPCDISSLCVCTYHCMHACVCNYILVLWGTFLIYI